jgi:hypothetical protein
MGYLKTATSWISSSSTPKEEGVARVAEWNERRRKGYWKFLFYLGSDEFQRPCSIRVTKYRL